MRNHSTGGTRLYCFAPAGASATMYSPWQAALQDNARIIPVEMPGHGARLLEAPHTSWAEMIGEAARAITEDDTPYALFGHSLGALLAFELAHHLRSGHAATPLKLFVSGCEAPGARDATDLAQPLTDSWLLGEIRHYQGTADTALDSPELMELLLPAFRADFSLSRQYHHPPSAPLSVPICIFAGREDPFTRLNSLQSWNRETEAPCDLHWFAGGHFFVNSDQRAVVQRIAIELASNRPFDA